jgi:hypothetical protein
MARQADAGQPCGINVIGRRTGGLPGSGQSETALQPASGFAWRQGPDDRGGCAGIFPIHSLSDVEIKPGRTPAMVRMAKLQNSLPYPVGQTGLRRKAAHPECLERVSPRCQRFDPAGERQAIFV